MPIKLRAGEFYGETAQALSFQGFRFTEKAYPASLQIPKHSHELAHFCFVVSGYYQERIERRTDERTPTALVYYPTDVNHAEKHHSRGTHFLVEIDGRQIERFGRTGANLDEPLVLAGGGALALAARMYREFCARDPFTALALESLTTELLITAARQNARTAERRPPRWLERTKELLRESIGESFSLTEIASLVGVHPTHLARSFRQFERCTVGDFLRKARIEAAREAILDGDASLVEIALRTGFADQTHFSRTFKKLTGMTPNEFRRVFGRG